MSSPEIKEDIHAAARALASELQTRYSVLKEGSPLAIGIDKQLLAAEPGLEKKVLRQMLRAHTLSTRYLKAMEKATVRLNLDGTTAGEVNEEQRTHATQVLRERFKKKAELKRAEEAAAQAERERAKKLDQLTEKFGRKKSGH